MALPLQLFLTAICVMFLLAILLLLRQEKLNIKYTLFWLGTGVVALVLCLFPEIVQALSRLLGIAKDTDTSFLIATIFEFLFLFVFTVVVTRVSVRVMKLSQTIALLEKRVRELEEANRREESEGVSNK